MPLRFPGFALALLLAPLSLLPARAQNSPSLIGQPLPDPNGFEKLFDAVEKISKADIIPADFEKLSDQELIQQKRNVASRNKRALFSLREAFQLPIQHPPVRTADDDFGTYLGFRTLAGILDQESSVRAIDSKWTDAINAKLDAIELGVLMTRGGPLRAAIAGRDIEIIGRRGIDALVTRLDNDQSAAAAARLVRIETLRPPFADAIREGKTASLALTKQAFDERNWDEVIAETLKLDEKPFTEDEQATLQTIGQAEIVGGINRSFDAALQSADAPYHVRTARLDYALDPWSTMLAGEVNSPALRVSYEAGRAQNRLLALALQLRVLRLQSGRYPDTFPTAPDPFGPGQDLKYKREGDSYLLYSVGPNAKDDGGTGLIIPKNGQIPPTATGDLVAPVLPL